jgi:hypothetical protein
MQTLNAPIDTYELLANGFTRGTVSDPMREMLMRRLGGLNYIDLPSDHCDAGPRQRALLEEAPQMGAMLRNIWCSLIDNELAGLAAHYRAGPDPYMATVLKLGSGYELDWHNHLGAGCTASLLIYLFEDETSGEGGDLLLGTLSRDLRTPVEEHRLSISHGDAIVIGDCSHPLMMHKAERWEGKGHRYLISFAFNSQEW